MPTATATKKKTRATGKGWMTVTRTALTRAAHDTKHTFKLLCARAKRDDKLLWQFAVLGIYQAIRNARHRTRETLHIPDEPYEAAIDPTKVSEDVTRLCAAYDYRLHGSGLSLGLATHEDILDSLCEIRRNKSGLNAAERYQEKIEIVMRDKGDKTVMEVLSPEKLDALKAETSS